MKIIQLRQEDASFYLESIDVLNALDLVRRFVDQFLNNGFFVVESTQLTGSYGFSQGFLSQTAMLPFVETL